ncbi:hypothetical protein RN001_009938 [Aquatica leii]|uniref:Uncharacterized protein n=1 Tax=Aquatica leii TaxID=1421715 RepID=A0AAN7PVV8_9COLE|nr:hypothetical protein RN001_009938 [Aquatica leii]
MSDSDSSGGSSNQVILMMQKDDFTLYGSPAPMHLNRSNTIRRASTNTPHKEFNDPLHVSLDDTAVPFKKEHSAVDHLPPERYRKSLDSTYRHSLESISEYKPQHSFSSASLFTSRDAASIESTSSDCTDYAMRSTTDATNKDKTFVSASSSYLSWIESVNSEYFSTANATTEVMDADTKVGEWNNFWLNYNSENNRYLSSPYLCISNDEKTGDDLSDGKSTSSTQREFTEKQISLDQVSLSQEEILEAIKCSQRITEILQQALKRNEAEIDDSKNDSYYSQPLSFLFSTFRSKEEIQKERGRSYSLEPQQLQRQKQMLKPPNVSGSSCINVLLNNGVTDILKKYVKLCSFYIGVKRLKVTVSFKMAEQFSLRWNNYHSNLSSGFHELMQANDMVDVTLAVEGQFLQAHKIVLSICSPLFKQLFKINPCKHPVIILRDVSYNNLKDILAFMYLGEVNVLRDNLSSFLRTAELLQVKGLTGDDSSDTSSKKDKTDSICDNEIEQDMQQFNQLINSSETQLPSSPTLNSTKRTTKSLNLQTKRSKSDTHTNSISTKSESSPTPPQVLEDESEYVQTPNIKHENSSYASENEDMSCTPEQLLDCKSVNRTTLQDSSSQDHDLLLYSVDSKGHVYCPYCYRKFVNRYNLKVHIRDKHDNNPINLDCIICGKTMRNRSCLRVHLYHHRKQQLQSDTSVA